MKVSKNRKKEEALKRLRVMGIDPRAIQLFSQQGKVQVSVPPYGILHDVTVEQEEMINKIEEEKQGLVYLVVNRQDTDAYLYISDIEQDYEEELADVSQGVTLAYVVDNQCPDYPGDEYIGLLPSMSGGVIRII